uniref:Uncharacterized protein n=1 Tax=Anguilla anguilla TaxID=7936 RepID=A0A0E9RHW2_ANGAN
MTFSTNNRCECANSDTNNIFPVGQMVEL